MGGLRQWWAAWHEVRLNLAPLRHRVCHLQHKVATLEGQVAELQRGMDRLQRQANLNGRTTMAVVEAHQQRLRRLEVALTGLEGVGLAELGNDELEPPQRRSPWEI